MFVPPRPRREIRRADDGMSTVEYAVGLIAAAMFAALLIAVVGSDTVRDGLVSIIERAFAVS